MKKLKIFFVSFLGLLLTGILSVVIFVYLQDEALEPEAKEFIQITSEEMRAFNETRKFLLNPRIYEQENLTKSVPCLEKKPRPEDENKFLKNWEEFQKKTQHFDEFIQPHLKNLTISIGGTDLVDTMDGVKALLNFANHVFAQECYYQIKKMDKELKEHRKDTADLLLRSFQAPQVLISQLVVSGMMLSFFKINSGEELQNFRQQMFQIINNNSAEDFFWKNIKYDMMALINFINNNKNRKWDFSEWVEIKTVPQNRMINNFWRASAKREIPEISENLLEDHSWWTLPKRTQLSYEAMTFSRWKDTLNRMKNIWLEMRETLSDKKAK